MAAEIQKSPADIRRRAPSAAAALELPCSPDTPMAKVGHSSSASYATDTPPGSKRIARTSTTSGAIPMPEKTVKRRLQDCDAALASDDGPIFSTVVAKLVDALNRYHS